MGLEYDAAAAADGRVGTMRLANGFHMALGLALCAVGFWILILAGNTLKTEGASPAMLRELLTALALLMFGVGNVRTAISHWSYRFTPDVISLPGVASTDHGDSNKTALAARYVDDLIKHGIRSSASGETAVGGLIDAIAPNLEMAQPDVRIHAYRQIQRGIYLVVLLCSFVVAWWMADDRVFPLVAAIYFIISLAVVRPFEAFARKDLPPEQAVAERIPLPTPGKSIFLLVVAVIAPAALSYLANQFELPGQLAVSGLGVPILVILLPALCGSVLFFIALARQTADLKATKGVDWGLVDDFEIPDLGDGLLTHLRGEVPEPRTALRKHFSCVEEKWSGSFLFETAPELIRGQDAPTLTAALEAGVASPLTRPLVMLDLLGVILGLGACAFAVGYANDGGLKVAAMALGLLASSQYCMGAAHKLWKRADFRSYIFEVYVWSNFQRDGTRLGNATSGGGIFEDRSHTVLSGAIQARVLEMRSVQFSPGHARHATALDLNVDRSKALAAAASPYAASVLARRNATKARKQAEIGAFTPTVKVQQVGGSTEASVPVLHHYPAKALPPQNEE